VEGESDVREGFAPKYSFSPEPQIERKYYFILEKIGREIRGIESSISKWTSSAICFKTQFSFFLQGKEGA